MISHLVTDTQRWRRRIDSIDINDFWQDVADIVQSDSSETVKLDRFRLCLERQILNGNLDNPETISEAEQVAYDQGLDDGEERAEMDVKSNLIYEVVDVVRGHLADRSPTLVEGLIKEIQKLEY